MSSNIIVKMNLFQSLFKEPLQLPFLSWKITQKHLQTFKNIYIFLNNQKHVP